MKRPLFGASFIMFFLFPSKVPVGSSLGLAPEKRLAVQPVGRGVHDSLFRVARRIKSGYDLKMVEYLRRVSSRESLSTGLGIKPFMPASSKLFLSESMT